MEEKESVLVKVEVTGTPQPKLSWYHNEEEVLTNYSRRVAEDGAITIPAAEANHAGVYHLVAENFAGKVERTVELFVLTKDAQMLAVTPTSMHSPLLKLRAIAMVGFGNHVEQYHIRDNLAFRNEYDVNTFPFVYAVLMKLTLFFFALATRLCTMVITPENKLKNRFANICVCKYIQCPNSPNVLDSTFLYTCR